MEEHLQMVIDTADRILNDHCNHQIVDASESGTFAAELWQNLEQTGLTLAGIPDSLGGADGTPAHSLCVIRLCGQHAAPVPVAETYVAARLLAASGVGIPAGPITVAGLSVDQQLPLTITNVPFARWCTHFVTVQADEVTLWDLSENEVIEHVNIAGEPRDQVVLNGEPIESARFVGASERLERIGAATRVMLMSGALRGILMQSVAYAMERAQFGRPIAKFQAIQQQLAQMAGEVAASQRAADELLLSDPWDDIMPVAIAKSRVGDAVCISSEIAHQVHGAMGYTREHPLNLLTRRLWCWRDEYGSEQIWQNVIGRHYCQAGTHAADQLWDTLTQ